MMNYRLLGRSGLRVSELCLGTMTFGEDWGWGSPKDEAQKIYDAFREDGGNFIDTANVYTQGSSETFLGEFVSGHRDQQRRADRDRGRARGRSVLGRDGRGRAGQWPAAGELRPGRVERLYCAAVSAADRTTS